MIIFDLDGTLADCEHRRHFVDPNCLDKAYWKLKTNVLGGTDAYEFRDGTKWKPDWNSFYEACDKDTPIQQVIEMWNTQISLGMMGVHQIWSGRSESVRRKTEEWLNEHLLCFDSRQLKMRPIGDYTPDDQLKERWLDETINKGIEIDFVFDDRPKVIRMWQRRGIFVFNCNQKEGEF